MEFLSLGLHRYEPQNTKAGLSAADTPKPDEQRAQPAQAENPFPETKAAEVNAPDSGSGNLIRSQGRPDAASSDRIGKVPGADGRAAQASAEQLVSDGVSQDNWSKTGIEIIRSVLRAAETRMPPPDGATSSQTPRNPKESREASETEFADLSTAIEEMQRRFASGMAENDRVASETKEPELAASHPGDTNDSTPALSSAAIRAAREIPARLAADPSAASARPASEIPPGPSWMAKLASRPENALSTVPAELLSPVLEELRRTLEANEVVHGLAEHSVPSQSEAGQDPAWTAVARQAFLTQNELSPSPVNQELARAPLPTENEIPRSPANRKPFWPIPAHNWAPKFATFKFGYLPRRGLLYSVIGHEVALFGLFLLITYGVPSFREERLIVGSIRSQGHVIYLPEIGGGTEGEKSPGGGESKPQQAPAPPARASKGFAYPGSQAILSNPPNPTNPFQTVLRPLVVHPEPLKKLVPLPNIVLMSETRLPPDLVRPEVAMPRFEAPVEPIKVRRDSSPRRQASWNVPVKAPQLAAKAEMPKLVAAEQPLPQAPKVQPKPAEKPQDAEKPAPTPIKVSAEKKAEKAGKEVAPPSTAQVAPLEMHGSSLEPLLSLSPAPLPSGNAKVPPGEARGRFAIAPGGKPNGSSVNPGKPDGTQSESPAAGQEKSHSANATTELASNAGTGAGHNPAAGGGSGNSKAASGGGPAASDKGSGKTPGPGAGGGAGNSDGRASAGPGSGSSGTGAGTGSGAGIGAGKGSFPGISIQGGEGNEGTSESHSLTVAPQTPYQMTIVATASSGGGLPDFGVFENQRVYTVYVPMQRTPREADPTWTLQYALKDAPASNGSGELVAPTPVIREWPQIPGDLETANANEQVIVYAVLATDGRLTHISVKQTPDARVSVPIVQALAKWVFRPAQLDNKPVAIKILIGIPL